MPLRQRGKDVQDPCNERQDSAAARDFNGPLEPQLFWVEIPEGVEQCAQPSEAGEPRAYVRPGTKSIFLKAGT